MDIVNTQWSFDSLRKLINDHAFAKSVYQNLILPDVLLLKLFPKHEKFLNDKFWSFATLNGKIIKYGFKMKWHNIGNGRVQLRVAIAIINHRIYLCQWYVKSNEKVDQKEMIKLRVKIQKIMQNIYEVRGIL